MKFYRIPMTTRTAPTAEELSLFLDLVNDAANQPVYVHCAGGRHRTVVMTAVYRMAHDGWTPDQAFQEMKPYDFGPDFLHPEFKEFAYGYRVAPAPAPPALAVTAATAANLTRAGRCDDSRSHIHQRASKAHTARHASASPSGLIACRYANCSTISG